MANNDLRAYFDDELHTRPFMQLITPNQRIFHFAVHCGETELKKAWRHLGRMVSKNFELDVSETSSRFFIHQDEKFAIRFERHTEFVSLMLLFPDAVDPGNLFDEDAPMALPADLIDGVPGSLISATWMEMVGSNSRLRPEDVAKALGQKNIATVLVSDTDQDTRVYNAFKLDGHGYLEHGFNRILVKHGGLSSDQTGRLVMRLVELETYRQLALLSLPLVRKLQGKLGKLERDIEKITQAMDDSREGYTEDFQRDLEQLSGVMARIERISSESSYRLAATTAYKAIADQRLVRLRQRRVHGFQTLTDFLERRFYPAISTCEAFRDRLNNLADRAQRSNTLLRTRIEMRIQIQNNDLLKSMESRARVQLRLQETVELLSVAAITYYMVSLLAYLLEGMPAPVEAQKPFILALAVPLIALGLIALVRVLRRKMSKGIKDT